MAHTLENQLRSDIEKSLQTHIDKVANEIGDRAIEEFKATVRKTIGTVAIDLANYYRVESNATEFVIRVAHEQKGKA